MGGFRVVARPLLFLQCRDPELERLARERGVRVVVVGSRAGGWMRVEYGACAVLAVGQIVFVGRDAVRLALERWL